MYAAEDSIVAIATPPGRGGIGIVRISGPEALRIAHRILALSAPLTPRYATFTRAFGSANAARAHLDEVIATYFPAPASYTGEHVVEVSAHGSPVVLEEIVRVAVQSGARIARPGEFTLRAFLNGKRDLVQSEAIADLVDSVTPLQARVAFDQLQGTLTSKIKTIDGELTDLMAGLEASLDFPDEGYHFMDRAAAAEAIQRIERMVARLLADARRGRIIRRGATVVLVGRPNVGKSSIFNMLLGSDRAIVTPVAGTTRDLISDVCDVAGLPVTLVDTAGLRDANDRVEREGVARATHAAAVADVALLVYDASAGYQAEDRKGVPPGVTTVLVANKCDLGMQDEVPLDSTPVQVSALSGEGFDELRTAIVQALVGCAPSTDTVSISNERHITLLELTRAPLVAAATAVGIGASEEFVLADLYAARDRFDEILGRRTSEDMLRHIFGRFCIGK